METSDRIGHLNARIRVSSYDNMAPLLDSEAAGEAEALLRAEYDDPDVRAHAHAVAAKVFWLRHWCQPEPIKQRELETALKAFDGILTHSPHLILDRALAQLQGDAAAEAQAARAADLLDVDDASSDAELAVALLSAAVRATPPHHADRSDRLSNLGMALQMCYEQRGSAEDLDSAIDSYRNAVAAASIDDPYRPAKMADLGTALLYRFRRDGDISDLDDAVENLGRSMAASAKDDPIFSDIVSNLSAALSSRFEKLGRDPDLDNGIRAARLALSAAPADEPGSTTEPMVNLAALLLLRYERTAGETDLEEAVELGTRALSSTAAEDPKIAVIATNLAISLHRRYVRYGNRADLDAAVKFGYQALSVPTDTANFRPGMLSNLSAIMEERYTRTEDSSDLDAAVDLARQAVESAAEEDPGRPTMLSNLTYNLLARYFRSGDEDDLVGAIDAGHRGLKTTGLGHFDRIRIVNNLGSAFRANYWRTRNLDDLEASLKAARFVLRNVPEDHIIYSQCRFNLGRVLKVRHQELGDLAALAEAITVLSTTADAAAAAVPIRIEAAQEAAKAVIERGRIASATVSDRQKAAAITHNSMREALPLYRTAIELMPRLALRGLDRQDRQFLLETSAASLAREAAACALGAGENELAVELLEHGRAVVWRQLLELRGDFSMLQAAYPEEAAELHACQVQLDATAGPSPTMLGHSAEPPVSTNPIEAGRQFDALVDRIRALPPTDDFPRPERFMRLPEFSNLVRSVGTSQVVIVNVSDLRCDAILVYGGRVSTVALPTTATEIRQYADRYVRALRRSEQAETRSQRAAAVTALDRTTLILLGWMWEAITEPILNRLGLIDELPTEAMSRIWWCPTGPLTLLPLHAAGHHRDGDAATVLDRVTSSYTPTIQALSTARQHDHSDRPAKMLAIALRKTSAPEGDLGSKYPILGGAEPEQRLIRSKLGQASCTSLSDEQATHRRILGWLADHRWIHFAGHAEQDLTSPGASGLVPYDWQTSGLVTITDLTRADLNGGELAFLSGCRTATGGIINFDEVVTLTAALSYTGWQHVIGTLWSIGDNASHALTEQFYTLLTAKGSPDCAHSARALHEAVLALRDADPGRPSRWARFVHIGT